MIFNKKAISVLAVLICSAVISLFAEAAKVTYIVGKVEVNRNGAWQTVKVNDLIQQGETISTGFQSEAVLSFNGSSFKVAAMTRVKLDALVSSENKVSISVNSGSVRSKVAKPADGSRAKYTATTPVAVASVRGTDFTISADGSVSCTKGKVVVWSKKKYDSIRIKAAQKKAKKSKTTETESETADEIDDWNLGGQTDVEKGQSTSLGTSGDPKKPMTDASDTLGKTKDYVTTAGEKDAVAAGGDRTGGLSSKAASFIITVKDE